MNFQEAFYNMIAPAMDFWLLISLLTTLVVVQFFKAAIKHYAKNKLQPFTITAMILSVAIITGYLLTRLFLEMPSIDERRLAMAVALLNVAIYELTLVWAVRHKMVNIEALLRMKKVGCRDDEAYVTDRTVFFYRGKKDVD